MTEYPLDDLKPCDICGKLPPDDEMIREARRRMAEVNHYGNLHCEVDDGNLEDHWFDTATEGNARQSVIENRAGAGPAEQAKELELVTLLESMSEAQRFTAYGYCPYCPIHGNTLEDDES